MNTNQKDQAVSREVHLRLDYLADKLKVDSVLELVNEFGGTSFTGADVLHIDARLTTTVELAIQVVVTDETELEWMLQGHPWDFTIDNTHIAILSQDIYDCPLLSDPVQSYHLVATESELERLSID